MADNVVCALYGRSTASDRTCDRQFRAARAFVRRRGWRVYGQYADIETAARKYTSGLQGATDHPPALQKMLEGARAGRFNCIVVSRVDRFALNMTAFHEHLQLLESHGVRFVASSQKIDTGAAGENRGAGILMAWCRAFEPGTVWIT